MSDRQRLSEIIAAAAFNVQGLAIRDDARTAEAILSSDWLAEHDRQVAEDVMLAFFERFKASGSVSVPVIRSWWHERLSNGMEVRE